MKNSTRTIISTTASAAMLGFGAAAPAQAAAPNACEDLADCTIVSRADVDGDGTRDSVGLTQSKTSESGYSAIIHVATADGETLTTQTHIRIPTVEAWWGAAAMDGEKGHELVLQSDAGAHTGWYRVITYRDGRLTTLRDPHQQYRWPIDSSASSGAGYRRTVMSSGKPLMYSYRYRINNSTGRYVQAMKAVTWSNGHWSQVSRSSTSVSPKTQVERSDWAVPDLPKRY